VRGWLLSTLSRVQAKLVMQSRWGLGGPALEAGGGAIPCTPNLDAVLGEAEAEAEAGGWWVLGCEPSSPAQRALVAALQSPQPQAQALEAVASACESVADLCLTLRAAQLLSQSRHEHVASAAWALGAAATMHQHGKATLQAHADCLIFASEAVLKRGGGEGKGEEAAAALLQQGLDAHPSSPVLRALLGQEGHEGLVGPEECWPWLPHAALLARRELRAAKAAAAAASDAGKARTALNKAWRWAPHVVDVVRHCA
jgi:hypothetical protein